MRKSILENILEYTLKIPIQFSKDDEQVLIGQSKILNWSYNYLLSHANDLRSEYLKSQDEDTGRTLYTKYGLRNLLPTLKREENKIFLKSVHSVPLKNAALRLTSVIQDYQKSRKGKRKGLKVGWPKYRSFKRGFFSLLYDEYGNGFRIEGRECRISCGMGEKGKNKVYLTGTLEKSIKNFSNIEIRNLRITKDETTFYACICVRKILPEVKEVKNVLSIDPNHKNLGVGVSNIGDSIEIMNPYFLRTIEKRIDCLKSKRDKCKKKHKEVTLQDGRIIKIHSRRWNKFDREVKKLNRLRREQTKCYLYAIANKLYKEYDHIAVGDYTPRGGGINRGMRRSMNNHSLIGRFKEILHWVALRSGKEFSIWKEYNSTKTCSNPECEFIHESSINPNIRTWTCPECLKHHLRDENAAINGLYKIKEKLPCLGHLNLNNIKSRCVWRFNGLGIEKISGIVNVA
jgi:putative transposase